MASCRRRRLRLLSRSLEQTHRHHLPLSFAAVGPIAITFPSVLLLWELLLGRDTAGPNWIGWPPQRLWCRARKHIPFAVITLLFVYLRSSVAGDTMSTTSFSIGRSEAFIHFLTQTKALALYYLRLAVIPIGQNVDVEYPVARSLFDPWFVLAIAVFGLVGWLLFRFRRQRAVVFWTLWFPTCLLVTTYLIPLGQRVREARMYLSLVGVCAVTAIVVVMIWRSPWIGISGSARGKRSARRVILVTVLVVIVSLGTATVTRNAIWSSSLELWRDASREDGMGTWRAHMNYALALETAGRADAALEEFEKAAEMGPYSWAYVNLGLAQVRRGITEGEAILRRTVEIWPELPENHYYLAVGLAQLAKVGEAEQAFKQSIALRDNYLLAYQSLGGLYEQQGQIDLAVASCEKLLEFDPGQTAVVERIQKIRTTGRQDPEVLLVILKRAFAAQEAGRRDDAIRLYEEVLTVDPRHRQVTFNLAYAYLEGETVEEWSRAAELFLAVLEIDPSYTEAANRLAAAYWKLGRRNDAVRWDRLYLGGETHPALEEISQRRIKGDAH